MHPVGLVSAAFDYDVKAWEGKAFLSFRRGVGLVWEVVRTLADACWLPRPHNHERVYLV